MISQQFMESFQWFMRGAIFGMILLAAMIYLGDWVRRRDLKKSLGDK